MQAITAIVRPEKVMTVQDALTAAGFNALTKWSVSGRGKEKGIKVGEVLYQEMSKFMFYIVVEDEDKDTVVDIIMENAKTGEQGNPGDGRIFVNPVTESYTVSKQQKDLKE